MEEIESVIAGIPPPDREAAERVRARLKNLTKPEGSLGRLEELAEHLASIQGRERPDVRERAILVFAADHGVTGEGVSAYPREVTPAMVRNFLNGGAAISVLSRVAGARLHVVDIGVDSPPVGDRPGFSERKVRRGTRNLARENAMSLPEARQAVMTGIETARTVVGAGAKAVALGDMGIGNTTSASALVAALTGKRAAEVVGRGTGIDEATLARKVAVVDRAVSRLPTGAPPWEIMEAVGGFEIAGIAGAALYAASQRCAVVVDGLISAAGALWATRLSGNLCGHLVPSHLSVEPGHRAALSALGLSPYLDLSMRLGEGTGAALALLLCDASCRLLSEMATFEEAEVAGRL